MALFRLVCAAVMMLAAGSPLATIINFDDIDASAGDVSLDGISPYQGFDWTNFFAYTTTPGFPGFNNGIVSPPNAAYSGGELLGAAVTPVVGEIGGSGPFNFVSAYVGAGYYDSLDVTVEGLRGGSVIFTQTVTVDTTGAQLFTFNFDNIDRLDFFGTQTAQTTDPFQCGTFNCTQFTLDDLTFGSSTTPPPPLPEPSSLALVGLGMFAAAAIRRRLA